MSSQALGRYSLTGCRLGSPHRPAGPPLRWVSSLSPFPRGQLPAYSFVPQALFSPSADDLHVLRWDNKSHQTPLISHHPVGQPACTCPTLSSSFQLLSKASAGALGPVTARSSFLRASVLPSWVSSVFELSWRQSAEQPDRSQKPQPKATTYCKVRARGCPGSVPWARPSCLPSLCLSCGTGPDTESAG